MKHITIVIPTRNRVEKLQKTLESVPTMLNLDIVVIFDGDKPGFDKLCKFCFPAQTLTEFILYPQHSGSVYIRNLTKHPQIIEKLLIKYS